GGGGRAAGRRASSRSPAHRRDHSHPPRRGTHFSRHRARHGLRDGALRQARGDGPRAQDRRWRAGGYSPGPPRHRRAARASSTRCPCVMLEVAELRSGYGRLEILQGVALSVAPGTIVGVIGPNGAGKSTLLKTIFGYLPPFAGRITLENRSLIGLRPDQMLKLGAGFVAQAGGLFAEMTVHENLLLGGYGLPSRRELAESVDAAYERFPRLRERRRQPAGSLSGGEPRALAPARAAPPRACSLSTTPRPPLPRASSTKSTRPSRRSIDPASLSSSWSRTWR